MRCRHVAGVGFWADGRVGRVDLGALLAELAGDLVSELGVVREQAGDLCAGGVQAGA